MDYGSQLKRSAENPNVRSASHSRQSPFRGSDREMRGMILRRLLSEGEIPEGMVRTLAPVNPDRLDRILQGLEREGFIARREGRIRCRDDPG